MSSSASTPPRGTLLVVSAPSGAGKTSLVRALIERVPGLELSVSHTTRPRREGEMDGVDYHFVDEARFLEGVRTGRFLEHAEVFGNRYGTARDAVEERLEAGADVLLEIDWQGAQQVRELLPEAVSVFILPPSRSELESRLRNRGKDSEAVIERRLQEAAEEISHHAEYDYLVVNDAFQQALEQLTCLVEAQRLRTARQRRAHAATLAELIGES